MQRFILFSTLFFFTSLISYGQSPTVNTLQNCQREWKYKDLEKNVIGTILFFDQPSVLCGAVSTASVALLGGQRKALHGDSAHRLNKIGTLMIDPLIELY